MSCQAEPLGSQKPSSALVQPVHACLQEIKLLQVTRDNPHLVSLLGYHVEADYAFLVLELMRGGDLGHAIPTDQHGMRWYGHGRHVALAIAQGLQGLHAKQVRSCCRAAAAVLAGVPQSQHAAQARVWGGEDHGISGLRLLRAACNAGCGTVDCRASMPGEVLVCSAAAALLVVA